MNIVRIENPLDSRVDVYRNLSDGSLRNSTLADRGIFIAESPKVIRVALDEGYRPLSLLCEEKHITGDAADIVYRLDSDTTLYSGSREVLKSLTGYTLTRGVLCAMERPTPKSLEDLLRSATRVGVLDGVCDATNTGSIFRAAAALGIDALLLTPTACDPLNRRSVRVSMGSVFKVPWGRMDGSLGQLKSYGFTVLALALKPHSLPIDTQELQDLDKIALVFGTEGDGLSDAAISQCDYPVVIPMQNGVDSLNVASAATLAFWQFRKKQ